jgi:hypothetical protein
MRERRFGPRELYAGSRFLAPLSEEALHEAGRAAGLHEGATLLELGAGNGCVSIYLAEEFHLYARGFEGDPELLGVAEANALRSPARQRLRFTPPEPSMGPVDFAVSFRVPLPAPARAGGRVILGRYVAPKELGFPVWEAPPMSVIWRRDASPLEWERFLAPLERALRAHRAAPRPDEERSALAEEALRQIDTFRRHAALVRYEILVATAG